MALCTERSLTKRCTNEGAAAARVRPLAACSRPSGSCSSTGRSLRGRCRCECGERASAATASTSSTSTSASIPSSPSGSNRRPVSDPYGSRGSTKPASSSGVDGGRRARPQQARRGCSRLRQARASWWPRPMAATSLGSLAKMLASTTRLKGPSSPSNRLRPVSLKTPSPRGEQTRVVVKLASGPFSTCVTLGSGRLRIVSWRGVRKVW
eukprot:scaffold1105_cov633-Prasinococcus_capsulatus_cf.AAC.2